MWSRIAEITSTRDVVRIRHEWISGPECRLRAALVRWEEPEDPTRRVALVGVAWEAPGGAISWGWPDVAGRFELRTGPDRPEVCSVLPPALSLALAFRRGGVELGERALILGDGFLARLACAVASAVGYRVVQTSEPGGHDAGDSMRADVVIETTAVPNRLEWATTRCRDWGRVYSLGGGLTSVPLNYYAHVHRRALTLTQVPDRPVLCAGEEEIVTRGTARLADAVRGIRPEGVEILDAQMFPDGSSGRLERERSGWGLLLVEG